MRMQVDIRRSPGHALATIAELSAMTALLLSYIWVWKDAFPGAFVVCVGGYFGIAWMGHRRRGESAWDIGLRLDNIWPATRLALIYLGPLMVGFLALGAALDSYRWPPAEELPLRITGLWIWGAAQQYGMLCFYLRRLTGLLGGGILPPAIAAGMFAGYHAPNPTLMLVTFVGGVLACDVYRRRPNLGVIALFHALVSAAMSNSLPLDVTFGMRVGPGFHKILEQLY